jgi:tRNA (mo5U34)-methyltransferase
MGKFRDSIHNARRVIHRYRRKNFRDRLPLKGYEEQRNETKFVDLLSDADLIELNNILDWNCFTVDRHGRRFGNAAWRGKRSKPEVIPDRRILLLNDRFDLATKHVLEVGCFEGNHTIPLCQYAKKVTAIDARIENVVKTIVRCSFFGYCPTVFKWDVEERPTDVGLLKADVAYHVGVLYHLKDPVRHLLDLGSLIQSGVLMDTHYALEEEVGETYEADGRSYRYKRYREPGSAEVFSGIYDHSKWLMLRDITEALFHAGFTKVEVIETRNERNGPRVLLIGKRA